MNDELTPDERAALRARIVGGARDIKPAGAHRNAWIAGSIAAVLVVGIAGGVAATSTWSAPPVTTTPSPSPTVSTTATPTATPTASPTPTATAPSVSLGSAPFAGSCANVVGGGDLEAATGHSMGLVGSPWTDGTSTVRGGMLCSWWSTDAYAAATVEVAIFTSGQTPPNMALFAETGCVETYGMQFCTQRGTASGTTAWVRVKGADRDAVDRGTGALLDTILSRASDYPSGVAATPTAAWWPALDCERVREAVDPASLSFSSVTVQPDTDFEGRCRIRGIADDGDGTWSATAYTVAGGAVDLPTVVAAGGQRVDVAGAREAYWVPWHDGIDGGGSDVLVVSDGVNLLLIDVPFNLLPAGGDLPRVTTIAERLLPGL